MLPTDLTVSAVIERDGKYLIVEERSSGVVVLQQPGGHMEAGEAPRETVTRRTLQDTGWHVTVRDLLATYLWIHPQTRRQFLRVVFIADQPEQDPQHKPGDGVHALHWYTADDLRRRRGHLSSPVVLRCIEDHVAGRRQTDEYLAALMPIQQNVASLMANATLI